MKKRCVISILFICFCFCLCGCNDADEIDYSSQLRLNINHIDESDETKEIHISYPVFGGFDDKEAVTIINTSISNYVNSEYEEFHTALVSPDEGILANGEKDADKSDEENDDEEDSYAEDTDNEDSSNEDSSDEDSYSEDSDGEVGEDGDSSEENIDTDNTDKGEITADDRISLIMNFRITYNKNNYLGVIQTYDKNLGDDMTFSGRRSFFFSLENATYLTLGEIFDFDSGFSDYVNKKIREELEESAYTIYDNDSGFIGVSKNNNFYIDSKHLYIYYDAMEISPDKDVIPTFVFSSSEVKDYLSENFQNIF